MMHINADALGESLARLRAETHEPDIVRAVQRIVASVNQLFDHDGAGVMLVDQDERLRYVAASDEVGRGLEEAQDKEELGPCYDAYVYGRPTLSKDVHSDARWPELAAHLDHRIRAVAGMPIRLGGGPIGTVNVYRGEPVEWDDSDVAALRAYARLIEEILTAALAAHERSVTTEQLQYALDYRVVIERAIGYLMASHGLDAVTAFHLLRRQARDSRRRVADLAAEVLGETVPLTPPRPDPERSR